MERGTKVRGREGGRGEGSKGEGREGEGREGREIITTTIIYSLSLSLYTQTLGVPPWCARLVAAPY